MGFPRQEYWSGLPFPSPGDFSDPGVKPASFALAGGFLTTEPPGKFLHKFILHHLDNHWKHLIKKKDLLGILSSRYHEIQFIREDWTQHEQPVSVNVHVCVCVCVCVYTQEVGVLGSIKKDFLDLEWVWIQTKDCGFNLMGSLCWYRIRGIRII